MKKIAKKFIKNKNIENYKFVRNHASPTFCESIWINKNDRSDVVFVDWKNKKSYFVEDEKC